MHIAWPRALVTAGFVVMAIGTLDPLEGSVLILAGAALVTAAAFASHSPHRTLSAWAVVLLVVGVATLWAMSAVGGIGGATGRPMWWAVVLAPYPIGFIAAMTAAVFMLIDFRKRAARA